MRKRRITKLFAGLMAAGMIATMPGMTNVAYAAESGSGSVEINETNFPDEEFRNYVSENFDTDAEKGVLSQAELDAVTSIDVSHDWNSTYSNGEITSVVGVEYFSNLQELNCSYNQITSLNVTKNSKLTKLYCNNNSISCLDVTQNGGLIELDCSVNQITSLDVSNNSKLKVLNCSNYFFRDYHIANLDISNNLQLTT